MNIKIQQAENSIENVDRSVISALYNAHINGDISQEVDNNNQKVGLVGSITAPAGYAIQVSTLNSAYPKFHVTVNSEYISFEDANVEQILLNIGLGDGVGITVQAASNATFTSSTFQNNTTITSFNEFSYFTKANTNPPVNLFSGCTNLAEIDLTSAEKISDGEFRQCGITSANLSSISVINNNAFSDSSLGGDLNIPNLISMGSNAFYNCTNLTKVSCLGKISAIPERAFVNYKNASEALLQEVILPYECLSLSGACFQGQSSLRTVKQYTQSIDSGQPLVASNQLRITTFGGYCFFNCSSLQSIDISNAISISEQAFRYTQLSGQLNLPNLNNLGQYAFANSKISEVSNLGSITTVPSMCFNSCSNLSSVTLSNDCKNILDGSFAYCSALTTINLGGVTSIAQNAFINDYVLTTVIGLQNVVSIGSNAFNGTKITSIPSNNSIETIGNSAFHGCNITEINLPNAVSINSYAFNRNGNPITSLTLPHTLEFLGQNAFIKVNDPNCCIYLPLITTTDGKNNRNWFSSYYDNGQYISTIGQLYVPNMENLYDNGHGSYPYWQGFASCLKAQLIYLKDITDLYPGTFSNSNIQAIVIDNIVPPTLNDTSDGRQEEGAYKTAIFNVVQNWAGFIYVPDGYVNTYISAWENVLDSTRESSAGSTIRTDIVLKNRIKSISELPTYATEADWIVANRPLGLITAYMN